jgi:hypothetical protein
LKSNDSNPSSPKLIYSTIKELSASNSSQSFPLFPSQPSKLSCFSSDLFIPFTPFFILPISFGLISASIGNSTSSGQSKGSGI